MGLKIGSPKERFLGESRVAMTPESALQLQKLGYDCFIETGAGLKAGFTDEAYRKAGVTVLASEAELYAQADVVAKVRPPEAGEVGLLREGQTLISFFYPAQNKELLEAAKAKSANVIAMDMVPRISRAQKMDALSSMANIAGYRAVIEAGNNFGRFFTGQVTAAGKVPPAKVLIIAPALQVSLRSARRPRSARSPTLSTFARKWPNRSNPWAPNSSSSISRIRLPMVPRPAAMPLRPRRNSAKSSWKIPRARARDRYRHHHRAHSGPRCAKALAGRYGGDDEARLGHH